MSVVAAAPTPVHTGPVPGSSSTPPSRSPSISRPSPLQAAPSHSILRPCNKRGIPIGPPVINPPPGSTLSIQVPSPAPAPGSSSATPTPTVATSKPSAPLVITTAPPSPGPVPVPVSPTVSSRTTSSTDSLNPPSLLTGQSSSPSTSAVSTLASSVSAHSTHSDAYETESSNESCSAGASTPRSSMISPSPKIRFGHLPERPAELRRRNSITLGVLARKNMLHAQGTIPNKSSNGGFNKVYMTDAEWEAYQQKFAKPNTTTVDLGAVVSSGAKNFWRKVRRGSNASVASNASVSSTISSTSPAPRGRSDSAPSHPPVSPRVGPAVDVAPVIEEEDEPHSTPGSPKLGALHLTSLDGDATPGRRRSPSPTPMDVDESAVYDDEDDSFSQATRSPVSATSSTEPDSSTHQDDHDHGRDDADAEWNSHKASSTAALGFDMRDYSKRPTWGRRGSGAQSSQSSPKLATNAPLPASAEAAAPILDTVAAAAEAVPGAVAPPAPASASDSPPISSHPRLI